MVIRLLVFLVINFAALGIGGFLMANGPTSDWYISLNKAPWTPPGWIFGAAWTFIMVCFTIYMAYAWSLTDNKSLLITLYSIQWVLNVAWNPTFFKYHQSLAALCIIVMLTILVGYILYANYTAMKIKTVFILPYLIWLLIATSLNAYIQIQN